GGGIFNNGNSGNATVTVSASTLSGNSASDSDGGIYNNGAGGSTALTVSASTILSNAATGGGSANFNSTDGGDGTHLTSVSSRRRQRRRNSQQRRRGQRERGDRQHYPEGRRVGRQHCQSLGHCQLGRLQPDQR